MARQRLGKVAKFSKKSDLPESAPSFAMFCQERLNSLTRCGRYRHAPCTVLWLYLEAKLVKDFDKLTSALGEVKNLFEAEESRVKHI